MRLSLKRAAHAVPSRAAYRKFGASRSFFARCGIPQVSPSSLLRVPQLRTGAPCSHQRTWGPKKTGEAQPEPFLPGFTVFDLDETTLSPPSTDGCPILRVLCEGWDSESRPPVSHNSRPDGKRICSVAPKRSAVEGPALKFPDLSSGPQPPSPLSSRPKRSRVSYFAPPATPTGAALRRESRMQIINARALDRKSGGAQWRDLRLFFPWLFSGPQPPSPLSSRPKQSEVNRSLCGCSFLEMFAEGSWISH
jgi:hypothetical protein